MASTPNDERLSGIGFRTSADGTSTPEPRLGSVRFSPKRSPGCSQSVSFHLQHTAWTEHDGAPPQINDISQAPDGSLWLGSREGLYRFDGFTFERVRSIEGDSPASPRHFEWRLVDQHRSFFLCSGGKQDATLESVAGGGETEGDGPGESIDGSS
jgi:hypothetical protein